MTRGAVLFLVLLGSALPLRALEMTARARVDSTRYLVGDRITVSVDITHPRNATFQWDVPDTVGGFLVLERQPFTAADERHTTTVLVVTRFDSGSAVLPPLRFLSTVPGDTALRAVETNSLSLSVDTVPVDLAADIKDLKPPLSVPWTVVEILLRVGIVLLVLALVVGAFLYYRERKRKAIGEAYVPPPRPAHVIALDELGRLKEKRLWQQGKIKEFYTEVTEVLRRYFENRYGMQALEETTEEIVSGLQQLKLKQDVVRDTERILRRADLVKFAKHQPALPEHEEMFAVAYAVVEKTKAVTMTPVATAEAKGHVGS